MDKLTRITALYDVTVPYLLALFKRVTYPWEMLPLIKDYIRSLIDDGILKFHFASESVLVGENVKLHPSAVIEGPAVLGHNTEVRPGAYLRGNVITGSGCVIGNSSELKNCILLDHVQVPHYNYVGDSVLGNYAHMGAGAICSNLKADGKPVTIHSEPPIKTGLRKVGAFLGDHADIGCGCVLNPGTVIGKHTSVYPLTAVRGVFAEDLIIKSMENFVKKQ